MRCGCWPRAGRPTTQPMQSTATHTGGSSILSSHQQAELKAALQAPPPALASELTARRMVATRCAPT